MLILIVCGNRDATYNAVLFTLSGADLLLGKRLAELPLLSVCGLRFSEMTAFSSLTRDVSSWVRPSCFLFGFKSRRGMREMSGCVNSSSLMVFAGVHHNLRGNSWANSITSRSFIFNPRLQHRKNSSLPYWNYFELQWLFSQQECN